MMFREYFHDRGRYLMLASIVFTAIAAAAIWWILAVLAPLPPRTVVMATGPQGGAYAEWGARYREILAREGFELRLLPTAGALESLAKLRDPRSGVSVAFVQAGVTTADESPDLTSLGTVSYEPLWFFCRGMPQGRTLGDLRGKRISIGPEGSGTRALMLRIMKLHGASERDAEFLSLKPEEAKEKLLQGEIDAMALVMSWESPVVRRLLSAPNIGLVNFPRADAYLALDPYLNKVKVPTGVGDLAKNLPPTDVMLLAPKASLVVRKDIHPALQYLFLDAASQVHSGPGFFQKAGQFPAPEAIDLPLSADARHFYKSGPPFLQRYLPFLLAVLAEKLLILLIPLAGIVYPLLRFLPGIYGWGMRRRIFRLYGELKFLEAQLERHEVGKDPAELLSQLDRLDRRVDQLRVPKTFMHLLYTLRFHITMARERLEKRPAANSELGFKSGETDRGGREETSKG
jgi:TRAP transporter TAXI family solute receptor